MDAAEAFTVLAALNGARDERPSALLALVALSRERGDLVRVPPVVAILDLDRSVGTPSTASERRRGLHERVQLNIVSGALTYVDAETCTERTYSAGQAFVDPGQGHVHSAYNPTDAPMGFIATFFDAPADGPLLIAAADPGC